MATKFDFDRSGHKFTRKQKRSLMRLWFKLVLQHPYVYQLDLDIELRDQSLYILMHVQSNLTGETLCRFEHEEKALDNKLIGLLAIKKRIVGHYTTDIH